MYTDSAVPPNSLPALNPVQVIMYFSIPPFSVDVYKVEEVFSEYSM